ncbi:DUF4339 domain-containing protein [Agrobacterium salinitolerans]|nr:DUF4339 domain-containing protein [Agrobacterium salinitolerans]
MWHYVGDGDKVGPIDDQELRELIRSGVIARDTLVWRPGFQNWTEADNVLSPVFNEFQVLASHPGTEHRKGFLQAISRSAWFRASAGILCFLALFTGLTFLEGAGTTVAVAVDRTLDPLIITAVVLMRLNFRNELLLFSGGVLIGVVCQVIAMQQVLVPLLPGIATSVLVSLVWTFAVIECGKAITQRAVGPFFEHHRLRGLAIVLLAFVGLLLVVAPGAVLLDRRASSSPIASD